jgi:putative transcriptional regulator
VSPNAVTAIGEHGDPEAATKLVVGTVGMVDLDHPEPELRRLRVFAGYAGWGAGQLDGEVEQEAWILEPAHPDDPFTEGDLWSRVLRRKGGQYALLARMPADPSVN